MSEVLYKKQLFRKGEDIYIQKSTSFPQYINKLHSHDFIEINYIISGECVHYEYDRCCNAKKGDLFIINYDTPHLDLPNEKSKEPYLCYDITFTPKFLDNTLIGTNSFLDITSSFLFQSMNLPSNQAKPILKLTDSSFKEFERLFDLMYEEYEEQSPGYYDIIRSYLIQLLIKIFRKMDDGNTQSQPKKQQKYINLAIEYIKTNYNKKLSLQDIAYRSMLSKSYFSQIFKDTVGMSFLKFLQMIRVDHACEMLQNTDKSISEIAESVGFEDIKFFYTIFKKEKNLTPGEYREKSF